MNIPERWAYPAVLIGVAGHASSEFFAKLSGVSGPEASVWRYLLGGFGLILWALWDRDSRDLITPMRQEGLNIVWLSLLGVTVTYLFFHWALDYATVIQVATVTTTIPIFVGLANWAVNGINPGSVKLATGGLAILGIVVLLTMARSRRWWRTGPARCRASCWPPAVPRSGLSMPCWSSR